MYKQDWSGDISAKERYSTYSTFKTILEKEMYLSNVNIYCFRVALSQLRLNVLPINNNMNRYNQDPTSRLCSFCKNSTEDESHFLFDCSVYSDIREKSLKIPSRYLMTSQSTWQNKWNSRSPAKFVFHAIKRRANLIDNSHIDNFMSC